MVDENLFKHLITKKILSVKDNRLKIFNNIDISMYGSKAWAFTLQEIGKIKGEDYIYKKGYLMGEDSIKETMETIEKMKKYVPDMMKDLSNMIEITGFGIINIQRKDNAYTIKVIKNQIIEFAKELYKEKSMICSFYRGVYTAFINRYYNLNIELKEEKCICKGDDRCIFIS